MKQNLSRSKVKSFQKKIWDFYATNRRDFPWRRTQDPYRIFISEVMLQQTQSKRVKEKYKEFLLAFPSFKSLAATTLPEVLRVWQGLGYNRRARFLLKSAREVAQNYKGHLPKKEDELVKFPGIGKATAGSITAFAFNVPSVFIETNIRRVFIHEFFRGKKDVSDEVVRKLVSMTLSKDRPRDWYYALMDYGARLSKILPQNPNRLSRYYAKQSVFSGSRREARGAILKFLLKSNSGKESEMIRGTKLLPQNIKEALRGLEKEGVIEIRKGLYKLRQV